MQIEWSTDNSMVVIMHLRKMIKNVSVMIVMLHIAVQKAEATTPNPDPPLHRTRQISTREEDAKIIASVAEKGTNFADIARILGRPERAVKARYYNYLAPPPPPLDPELAKWLLIFEGAIGPYPDKIAVAAFGQATQENIRAVKYWLKELHDTLQAPITIIPTTPGVPSLTQTLIQLHLPSGQ
jgi:hypothetical protein